MIELLLIALMVAMAITAAGVLVVRHARRIPDGEWYKRAGAAFAGDERQRRRHYAVARDDAERLAALVETAAPRLERDWHEPTATIAREVVHGVQLAISDLLRRLDARDRGAADLTIVLYGRTKAGKSSLYAALAGRGFEGIGDGRQNFTRENRSIKVGSIHLVDAPGVDGVGSEPLEALTAEAVHEADLLVAQVTDDAVFAEDFERLSALGASARPVIVALNVKQANLQRLLDEPDKVFRKRRLEPHIARLRKALPEQARDGTPIVVYHALAAEQARRARDRNRLDLWERSRIRDVIRALADSEEAARRFALESCDEAVVIACDASLASCTDAASEVDARMFGYEKSITEVEGILGETKARARIGVELVDAHFASAEEELLAALELADARSFRSRVDKVLNLKALNARLKEALDETAAILQEKFDDFQTDVRLASMASTRTRGLDQLHGYVRREREARATAEAKARKRKWWRGGARVVGSLAAALAAETVVGAAVVAVVADRAIDTLFPDVEIPADDPKRRVEAIRDVIGHSRRDAVRAFERALESQILVPAHDQLLEPLHGQLRELAELKNTIAGLAASVGDIRDTADNRRDPSVEREALAA